MFRTNFGAKFRTKVRGKVVVSNDLAIGSTAERMEPVPAIAPTVGQPVAENQRDQPRRRPPPAEPVVTESTEESAPDSDGGSDVDREGPPHRVDSLA
ncbi:MAG: hypothetical protein WAK56_22445 [Candidatus Sulfotelmatobacter sp.]